MIETFPRSSLSLIETREEDSSVAEFLIEYPFVLELSTTLIPRVCVPSYVLFSGSFIVIFAEVSPFLTRTENIPFPFEITSLLVTTFASASVPARVKVTQVSAGALVVLMEKETDSPSLVFAPDVIELIVKSAIFKSPELCSLITVY